MIQVSQLLFSALVEPLRRWDLCRGARTTLHYTANVADHADERAAFHAGIALRSALLVTAGTAHHHVMLVKLCHISSPRPIAPTLGRSPSPYSRIFLMSVAREMPSSFAARVRFAECARSVRSMCPRSTSAS